MKYLVQVDGRSFQVEIEDLTARPVIAVVDGQAFEVWPQPDRVAASELPRPLNPPVPSNPAWPASTSLEVRTPPGWQKAQPTPSSNLNIVRAPIPGVIASIAVNPGDEVKVGGELCILEAMKMKNTIRATRAGRIAALHISPGQHVKHSDALMEYSS
jgi:biotin carboxyl carrier protein